MIREKFEFPRGKLNVIRNCSAYSEPMMSHTLGGLTGSCICSIERRADVLAAILKV